MKFVILALPGGLGSCIQGFWDIFAIARESLALGAAVEPDLNIVLATPDGEPITDGMGRLHGPGVAVREIDACDAVFVPGLMIDREVRLPDLAPLAPIIQFVRTAHSRGAIVASSCSGALVLAAAGLLNGRRCTTSWWLRDALKANAPEADLALGASVIEHGRVVTGGGPFSWIGVALRVLRMQLGAEAARMVANFTVVDTAPVSQIPFIPACPATISDTFIGEAERILRARRGETVDATGLADWMRMSVRTLQRRLKTATGETPRAFIERVRLDDARATLELTQSSLAQIAAYAGYADAPSFRRAFKRRTGMTPGAYRAWLKSR